MMKNLIKSIKNKINKLNLKTSDFFWIGLGLAVFISLALFTITKFSIWFDEAFGARLIHYNFWEIAKYTANDVHPPLFYWLLKTWSMMFGNTELALRSMSVFFGAISIIFAYLLTHKLFGKKAARISLIFICLSPMLIRYSQEARMYTLVAAIAIGATYALTVAMNSKNKTPWIIYGILVSLGMWTHYFTAIIWISHWIWRAWIIKSESKKGEFKKKFFSKQWVKTHILAVGLFLPWLPFLVYQFVIVQAAGFWVPDISLITVPNYFTNLFYYLDFNQIDVRLAVYILVITIYIILLTIFNFKQLKKDEKKNYKLLMTVSFAPILLLIILSIPPLSSVFIDRYLFTAAIFTAIFMGVTISKYLDNNDDKRPYFLIAFIVLAMTIGITNVYSLGNYNKNTYKSNNMRDVIAKIDNYNDNLPIIAASPWVFYDATFYTTVENPVYFIEPSEYRYGSLDMLKYSDEDKIKNIDEFEKNNSSFWYIGEIRDGELTSPYSDWNKLQEFTINDTVSGKPAYKAIQYTVE